MTTKKATPAMHRTAVLALTGEQLTFGTLEQTGEHTRVRWKRIAVAGESDSPHGRIDPVALTAALKGIVQDEKLLGTSLNIVLGGDYCVTRVVAGTREHVQHELGQLRSRSGLYLSLGQGPKTFAESVFAIDAKRAQGAITVTNENWLLGILQAAKEAGLKVNMVEHSLVALSRAVGKTGVDAESPVMLLEINQRGIDLGVSHRGRLLLDYRPGGVGAHRQLAEVVLKHLGRIQRYCGRHFQFAAGKISQVVICGSGPETEELREFFEREGNLKADTLDPRTVCPDWQLEDVGKEESWLVPILGAVVDSTQRNAADASPDLMAPIRLLQREPILPQLAKHAWPIAAMLLLTLGMYGVGLNEQGRVGKLSSAAEEAKEAEKQLNTQQLTLNQIDSKIRYLKVINDRISRPMWQNFLCDVSECLPEGTWLEDIKVDKDGIVSLSGPSYSENSVYALIEKLKTVPHIGNVALEGTRTARSQGGPITLFDVRAAYSDKSDLKKGS